MPSAIPSPPEKLTSPSSLPFCTGVPRDAEGAGGDGTSQREDHDPVLSHRGGGAACPGRDGATRAAAGGEGGRAVRDVRDPEQRDPGRRLCGSLRWILDRLPPPHAAHAGGGPRLRNRRSASFLRRPPSDVTSGK